MCNIRFYTTLISESSEYCLSYNTLNFPAGVVPMTRVTSEDIEKLRDYPTTNAAEIAAKKVSKLPGNQI